jgi:hypothetical protein
MKSKTDRKILKDRDGQALVEFAIVLPLLVVLLIGMMEFGLLLYNQQVITNASREGARFGIVAREKRWPVEEIAKVVDNYCKDYLITFGSDSPRTIDPTNNGPHPPDENALFQDPLTVVVEFRYDFLVLPNFIGGVLGALDLQAETTMLYE